MKLLTFELEILNQDGTLKEKKEFKSIREMALKTGLNYHNLKVIYERNNLTSEKYKNTLVNNLSKCLRINRIQPIIQFDNNNI